jgi:hypothetical protein
MFFGKLQTISIVVAGLFRGKINVVDGFPRVARFFNSRPLLQRRGNIVVRRHHQQPTGTGGASGRGQSSNSPAFLTGGRRRASASGSIENF